MFACLSNVLCFFFFGSRRYKHNHSRATKDLQRTNVAENPQLAARYVLHALQNQISKIITILLSCWRRYIKNVKSIDQTEPHNKLSD
jgi:hypothetical protein